MSQDVDGEAMEDYQDNSEQEALEVGDGMELDDVIREPGVEMNQTLRGINLLRDVDEEAVDDVEEEAHDGGDEVVMDAGAREPEETRSRSVRQSTIVRRLLPLSAPPPLQLELDELTSDVGTEITFEEVHKESSKTGNWEGYPTMNAHLHKGSLRGFRKEANYFVQEEDEKLLKYIVDKGMENYVKGKNLWLLMEREKVAENRSWQSMKERFLKSIVKRLDMFTSVGKEQKERLSKGAAAGKKRKKSATMKITAGNSLVAMARPLK